jgi:hypothetical protein
MALNELYNKFRIYKPLSLRILFIMASKKIYSLLPASLNVKQMRGTCFFITLLVLHVTVINVFLLLVITFC